MQTYEVFKGRKFKFDENHRFSNFPPRTRGNPRGIKPKEIKIFYLSIDTQNLNTQYYNLKSKFSILKSHYYSQ